MPIIYLLPPSLRGCICLPSVQCEPHCSRLLGSHGLFGISTHKVYPPPALLRNAVRSYRTFSPLPRRIEAVIFCDTCCLSFDFSKKIPPVRWCGCSTLSGLSSLPIARYRDRLVGNLTAKIWNKLLYCCIVVLLYCCIVVLLYCCIVVLQPFNNTAIQQYNHLFHFSKFTFQKLWDLLRFKVFTNDFIIFI